MENPIKMDDLGVPQFRKHLYLSISFPKSIPKIPKPLPIVSEFMVSILDPMQKIGFFGEMSHSLP